MIPHAPAGTLVRVKQVPVFSHEGELNINDFSAFGYVGIAVGTVAVVDNFEFEVVLTLLGVVGLINPGYTQRL